MALVAVQEPPGGPRDLPRLLQARIAHVFDHRKDTKQRLKWEIPEDILKRLKRDPTIWKNFQRFPESYKRIRSAGSPPPGAATRTRNDWPTSSR